MQIWVTKVLSAYCACLFANIFAPYSILLCGVFNYNRGLNFSLQVITDSSRQLARLFWEGPNFLVQEAVFSNIVLD